jgi:SAM-dependent methyltransferase
LASETDKIASEFDEDACDFCDRYEKGGLSRSSKVLLAMMLAEGITGKSAADLGCGAGGFTIELLQNGASTSVGYDLSPKMVESANKLAMARGFERRAKFQLGNAAEMELPSVDLVVMDKVLCCYSEWQPLLQNAISASISMLGFVVPRDAGIVKWPFRLGVRLVNYFQRRGGNLPFYLHPLDQVDRTLQESGFNLRKKQSSRFWLVFLYSRHKRP